MSPACYELVTRKLATYRSFWHVKIVWRVATFLIASRQVVGPVGIWQTTRQVEKPAADRRSTNHVCACKWRHWLSDRTWLPVQVCKCWRCKTLLTPFTMNQCYWIAIWMQRKMTTNWQCVELLVIAGSMSWKNSSNVSNSVGQTCGIFHSNVLLNTEVHCHTHS